MQPIDLARRLRAAGDVRLRCPWCGVVEPLPWSIWQFVTERHYPCCDSCTGPDGLPIGLEPIEGKGGA